LIPESTRQLADSGNCDVAVVGAGAAGLAAAIFTARRSHGLRIVALDGASRLGAKILVSGGGRCNITNVRISPQDFNGGNRNAIRNVLRSFTERQTVDFFSEIGVPLHEEQWGKLFPDSNSARAVLTAMVAEARNRGVNIREDHRVIEIRETQCSEYDNSSPSTLPRGDQGRLTGQSQKNFVAPETAPFRFRIGIQRRGTQTDAGATNHSLSAKVVVLATGGLSLPKTGSDGLGYKLAQMLGHSLTEPTPGLVPLILDGDFHSSLSGVTHDVEIAIRAHGVKPLRIAGPMLWTHFGVSGPAVLDASRHWYRLRLEGLIPIMTLNFLPGLVFSQTDRRLIELAATHPNSSLRNGLAEFLPARLADGVLSRLEIPPSLTWNRLTREDRYRLVHALLEWPIAVRESRGYNHAEVTAGGVPLGEVDVKTMASRKCPGLFLVGEILDVDGRIGGFNFQWAWSSAYVAAEGIARFFRSA